jgi:hypothetical protein
MAAIENPASTVQFEPHDGGIGPHELVLGDVEAALAAFKGSAVSDRDTQTEETVELMELMSAKITEVRPVV